MPHALCLPSLLPWEEDILNMLTASVSLMIPPVVYVPVQYLSSLSVFLYLIRNIIVISLISVTNPDTITQMPTVGARVRPIIRRIPLVSLTNEEGIDTFETKEDPWELRVNNKRIVILNLIHLPQVPNHAPSPTFLPIFCPSSAPGRFLLLVPNTGLGCVANAVAWNAPPSWILVSCWQLDSYWNY